MGCTQSKIEHEETVTRCKERKLFMKDAVSSRNAFTAAHTLYAMSLKNTGAALTDYAHGEVHFHHHSPPPSAALPPSAAAYDTSLPPPPPPLPNFQSSLPPLQRAATMPADISLHKRDLHGPADPIFEEEEEEEEEDDDIDAETGHSLKHRTSRSSGGGRARDIEDEGLPPPTPPTPPVSDRDRAPPPPPPQGMSSWDFFFPSAENFPGRTLTDVDEDRIHKEELERKMNEERSKAAEVVDSGGGGGGKSSDKAEPAEMAEKAAAEPPPDPPPATKVVKKMKHVTSLNGNQGGKGEPNVNLLWIFNELDNCFLEASESAHDVSMMLEANRLHYHSNFADNRGHINHSERVMRAITWNRSFKGLPNADDGIDDLDSEEHETHATVLDKMLAWEKKLYDEVKVGEEMKLEYQRKVASLNKLKKRGARTESIEKAKAADGYNVGDHAKMS